MVATRMVIDGQRHIVLVFDDGFHAIHHGLNVWTIHFADGVKFDDYDWLGYDITGPYRKGIDEYTKHHSSTVGRIS